VIVTADGLHETIFYDILWTKRKASFLSPSYITLLYYINVGTTVPRPPKVKLPKGDIVLRRARFHTPQRMRRRKLRSIVVIVDTVRYFLRSKYALVLLLLLLLLSLSDDDETRERIKENAPAGDQLAI